MNANIAQKINTLSALVGRAKLAARLGQHYGGDRDVYQALGYQTNITYADCYARYGRQDIARAIIDKPVDGSWHTEVLIQEADSKDTKLEKEWRKLIDNKQLSLISKLRRLDILTGIGEYAVLLMGYSDVKQPSDFSLPINPSMQKQLLYVRPFGQDNATIVEWDKDTNSPRYDCPKIYELKMFDPTGSSSRNLRVHWSRVIHVADNLLESPIIGESRLFPVYNRLMDLEKLVGGSAEMFWRGARPGYTGKLDEDFVLGDEEESDLEAQLSEYENNLRRFLILKGIDVTPLAPQVTDPKPHVDVQIEMISAVTGIPKRILTGSERGELASTQDRESWITQLEIRRTNWIAPYILRPVVDHLIENGVLSPPGSLENGYVFVWPPLYETGEKDKAATGEIRARALKAYADQPMAETIVPPEAFYRYFLGLDQDQIDLIMELQQAAVHEEMQDSQEDEIIIEEEN